MQNLYRQRLHDHYQSPRNRGTIANSDFSSGQHNPSCGDSVLIEGTIADGVISCIAFEGEGCVISLATASLLSEEVKGKTLDVVCALGAEDITRLIGITLGPVRLKCALLSLHALQEGIAKYQSRR